MMKRLGILCLLALTGCATNSGVLPDGKDSYLIIQSAGHWYSMSTPADLKIDAHKMAGEFCMGQDKRKQTVSEKTMQPGMLTDYAEYDLKFRCVVGIKEPEESKKSE